MDATEGVALASAEELAAKLPFEMDEGEMREATRALEELSDEARHYGSAKWLEPSLAPRQVSRLVLKAAARHMKNYEGYQTSRAGDESVTFFERRDISLGDASFTADEKKRIGELAGNYRATLHTVGLFHSANHPARNRRDDYVPTDRPGERLFPYGNPERPW